MEYNINKGIGRNVEFNGLQAQYLYFFVGGLLAIFLLFVIFYMIGIDRVVLYRFRCPLRFLSDLRGVPPEQEVWSQRLDEAGRSQVPPVLYHQSQTYIFLI